MTVSLKAGGNYVVYTGKAQSAADAFASIVSYLDPAAVVYYWNNYTALYEQVIYTTTMVPYGVYWIEVTQNCTWTYGADETPPTSVQLYGGRSNLVAYSGPLQSVEAALASIWGYLEIIHYFDNTSKYWMQVLSGHTMVPNTMYAVMVSQDCEWVFEVEVPPVAGTITKKELDYQDIWQALPIYNIPVDTRVRVRITGRNDTPEAQQMGIHWFVADPEGYVVQEYSAWEAWPYTGAGGEHEFVGSGFDLSKVGKYTMWVELLMNRDDPQVVDQYIGDLCSVEVALPEPEFRGFALTEYTRR